MLIFLVAALAAPPDVFLISADTLRADRLGCYGYPLPTSPNLDALAAQSRVFDDALCEVPLTAPSFCSMFTAQFPRVTGTTRNGLRLPASIPTIAENFHAAGYYTFCVQSNWTLKTHLSGLNRGFEVYDDNFRKRRWGIIKSERDADEVTRIALELLAQREAEKPIFAWIHYSDPHAPYKYRRGFDPRQEVSREVVDSVEDDSWRRKRLRVSRRYDSEVRFMDHHIGVLLEALPKDALILFVADHGESLYEHDYLGHGRRIYQPEMHIPMMIRAPRATPGRSATPVRAIDVGPTLLALAGLPPLPAVAGYDVLDPMYPGDHARIIETYGGAVPHVWGAKALMADAPPLWQGVVHEGWKLILGDAPPQLYYLPDDPGELENRAQDERDRVRALTTFVREWDAGTRKATSDQVTLSDEDRRALENLGYME